MLGFRRVRFATVGLVAGAVLAAAAMPAAAASQNVVLGDSTSTVEYFLQGTPEEPITADGSRSGNKSNVQRSGELSTEKGEAKASTSQATTTKHGPTSSGYTVRTIKSVGQLTGLADLTGDGGTMNATATARSVTTFTVNNTVPYAIDSTRNAQADDNNCSQAQVVLRRGGTIIFRKTLVSGDCPAAPDAVLNGNGDLTPGEYTLETHATGEARDLALYSEAYVAPMMAKVSATLTMGTGKVCRNVLSNADRTITGTSGNDVLCGGSGVDTIKGYGGNDTIYGMGSGDSISGGGGADYIKAGGGADTVAAGSGDDTVNGCDGVKDTLGGGRGTDTVRRDAVDVLSSFATKTRC